MHKPPSDWPFYCCFCILGGSYLILLAAILIAEASFVRPGHLLEAFRTPEIRYALKLSLLSCTLSTIMSLWVAVPLGYFLSRFQFPGKSVIDALVDLPIMLPPLVVGLGLLILFQSPCGVWFQSHFFRVSLQIPSVVLAQFTVVAAFAIRTMRVTFDQIDRRPEQVALTLGCSRAQAFWWITFPQARRGLLTAATLAWARAFGEFGPILVFSGTTRMRTEVLSTSVFLELSVGNVEAAVSISLIMIVTAILVLVTARRFGLQAHRP